MKKRIDALYIDGNQRDDDDVSSSGSSSDDDGWWNLDAWA